MDLTDGQRIYAIGDVHGCTDLLGAVLARIRADIAARPHDRPLVICLGDYVDRGPDSRGVIDMLIDLRGSDLPARFLLGNHDNYIPEFLGDPEWFDRTYHWLNPALGGTVTLASYGVEDASEADPAASRAAFAAAIPPEHLDFITGCALWERVGGYVFAHAGIRPGVKMADQRREDLIWIREPFLSSRRDHGFKVVHGHTIVREVEHHPNRIAIDTGAVKTGNLSCLVLEDRSVALLEPDGLREIPEGSGLGPATLGESVSRKMRSLMGRR